MSTALLSIQKNEAPYLIEFVSHHMTLGFDQIFLVTNPSDDFTGELAHVMQLMGFVRHVPCRTPEGVSPQEHGLSVAKSLFDLDQFEWLAVLDADELLNIHVGNGKILDLINHLPGDLDIASINIANFGNFPHVNWENEDASLRFLRRFRPTVGFSSQAKSLIHFPSNFSKLQPHGPIGFGLERDLKVSISASENVSFVSAKNDEHYKLLRSPGAGPNPFRFAQVNHYPIRTLGEYKLRQNRGRGAVPAESKEVRHTQKYFDSLSRARFLDDSVLKYRSEMIKNRALLLSNENVNRVYRSAMELFAARVK